MAGQTITIKYFASLREKLGKSDEVLTLDGEVSISEVWQQVSRPYTADEGTVLMAINKVYANPDAPVVAGDEVAFFPPVTGG